MSSVRIDVTAFHAAFFEEADEHVATMERGLLDLEAAPGDRETLARVFRAAHSIKGAAGTFGFPAVMELTHALETLLDRMREGAATATPERVALLLRSVDALRGLLVASRTGGTIADTAELREALVRATSDEPSGRFVRVVFHPHRDLFLRGMDPLLVVRDLAAAGEDAVVELDDTHLPTLDLMDPESSYLAWTVSMRTTRSEAELRDVLAFVEDDSDILIAFTDDARSVESAPLTQAAGRVEAAPVSGPLSGPVSGPSTVGGTLRVSSEKLDRLIDLLGELVIAQSMVTSAIDDPTPEGARRLREALDQMDRNTRELQDRVLSIRMVPIGTVFRRFTRVVHDIAASAGKKIRLELEGEETEIDKGMVELLADPLMHLVRNAADHGVESPDERIAAGKPEEGVVCLRALHQGGTVVVELTDDGRGLQTERILAKARERGLVGPDERPSDEAIQQLIFAPGFSTAARVTDVSGRGVGMDVVKRNVEGASGSVAFATTAGKGSTVRLKLPLTMAIMDGLQLRVGRQIFVVPLSVIAESFRPTRDQIASVLGSGEVVRVRAESLPLVRLHRVLGIEPDESDPTRALLCVVETAAGRAALLVDEVLGQAQVVVKSLETHYERVDGLTGATILGDGHVALILDIPSLVQRATTRGREAANGSGRSEAA